MPQSSIEVITPATSLGFVSLGDLKLALRITNTTEDELLNLIIGWASAEIATLCNRVFAKEKVVETITEIPGGTNRLFLSRWPVKSADIESVEAGGTPLEIDIDYEVDEGSGKLINLNGAWTEPVVIVYSGGYLLPQEAPLALQHSVSLLSRETYYASQRGDATVRMVSHKETRVIYFDPNASKGGGASSSAGSPTQRAVRDLLGHFIRYEI